MKLLVQPNMIKYQNNVKHSCAIVFWFVFTQEVNFSHNKMSVMKDLSDYSSLTKLILDRILLNTANMYFIHNLFTFSNIFQRRFNKSLCIRNSLAQEMLVLHARRSQAIQIRYWWCHLKRKAVRIDLSFGIICYVNSLTIIQAIFI